MPDNLLEEIGHIKLYRILSKYATSLLGCFDVCCTHLEKFVD